MPHRHAYLNQPVTDHREQLLYDLFQVELRQVTRDYLQRTHRSYPVHCIIDLSGVEQ